MILLIDNYDSFTYNLYHYLIEVGDSDILVKRNDKITIDEIKKLNPEAIVISPGPGTPDEAGICLDVIKEFAGKIAIFGVCLGHQAIGQVFGAKIIKTQPFHGKVTKVKHNSHPLFKDVNEIFKVARYHSLIIDRDTLDDAFEIIACDYNNKNIIMGIAHKSQKLYSVQFHPESIACEFGRQILKNFLDLCQ